MADDKKFAGFICTGCGIGERLDASQLGDGRQARRQDGDRAYSTRCCAARTVSDDPQDSDRQRRCHAHDDRGLLAPRQGRGVQLPDVAMSRANLREGVIWARPNTDENQETTGHGGRLHPHGLRRGQVHEQAAPGEQALNKTILVVGGGVTGMTAALENRGCRLRGAPGREDRRARRLGGQVAQAHPGSSGS